MIRQIDRIAITLCAVTMSSLAAAPARAVAQGGAAHMPAEVTVRTLENGTKVLADAKGMTLYTFARDSAGKSNCNGRCAENWPPLMAAENSMVMGDWTAVTRDDGKKMLAYKGKPLYTFARDAKPGDATGDGAANGAWKIAVP
jgi:predicted lipoprotein with Yx(FWY)xxD motif